MLLNSTHLSKSFLFCILLLIINRLTLICPLDWTLLTVSWFIFLVISQNLESPPYNTKEYYMGDFFMHLRAKSYEINV